MERYHRQMLLPQISTEGQERLKSARVLIVGMGGLGNPVAQYLVAAGVGHLTLVDGDLVQLSNLHRQILFTEEDIGQNKTEAAMKRLKKMNSEVTISNRSEFLDKNLGIELVPHHDIIIDGTDNFTTKFLINDLCAYFHKPWVYGAISQFEGQVGVFQASVGACYRCLYGDIPKAKIKNCAESGVLGVLPGVIGCYQALEAMKLILQDAESPKNMKILLGQIQFMNLFENENYLLKIPQKQNCFCHAPFELNQIRETQMEICSISSARKLIDVREKEEWDEFHLEESLHWPLSRFESGDLPERNITKDSTLICRAGVRAERAAEILFKAGHGNVKFTRRSIYEYQA